MKDAGPAPQKTPRNSDNRDSTTEILPALADLEEAAETTTEADPGDIIEQAEQLMRATAPHDYEVLVIGGGQAGCAAALRAAQLGARVGLVEVGTPGGSSLFQDALFKLLSDRHNLSGRADPGSTTRQFHTGQLPAEQLPAEQLRTGISLAKLTAEAEQIAAQESQLLQKALDEHRVTVIPGSARFIGEHTVEVIGGDRKLQLNAVHLIIATGAVDVAVSPTGVTVELVTELSKISHLGTLPQSCVIVRSGEFGAIQVLEWATVLRDLHMEVTVIDAARDLLSGIDIADEVRQNLAGKLHSSGLMTLLDTTIERSEPYGSRLKIHFEHGKTRKKPGDSALETEALLSLRREPATSDLGLDKAGIRTEGGFIKIDDGYNTNISGVYAVGDCVQACSCREYAVTHGIRAAESALEKPLSRSIDSVAVHCRTHPPLAVIGKTDGKADMVSRGRVELRGTLPAHGPSNLVEIFAARQSDRVLGCVLLGEEAVQLAGEVELALQMEMTCHALAATYPCPVDWSAKHGLALAAQEALRDTRANS